MDHCRTCLDTGARTTRISIMSMRNKTCLMRLMPNIDLSDMDRVCYRCEWTIRKIENFIEQCYKADDILRGYPNANTESIEKTTHLSQTNVLSIDTTAELDLKLFSVYTHAPQSDIKTDDDGPPDEDDDDMDADASDALPMDVKIEYGEEADEEEKDDAASPGPAGRRKARAERKKKADDNTERRLVSKYKLTPFNLETMRLEHDRRKAEREFLEAEHKCQMCAVAFKNELTLKKHMTNHGEDRGFHVCPICTRRHSNPKALESHQKFVHSFKSTCEQCGFNAGTLRTLVQHLVWHEGIIHQCNICQEILTSKRAYKDHMTAVHKKTEHKCAYCDKVFNFLGKLKRHEAIHMPPTHTCETCSKKFHTFTNLVIHMKTHSDLKPIYCVECDMYFKHDYIFKRHLKTATKHLKLEFSCKDCAKKFPTTKALDSHIQRIHLKTKKFICEICSATYASNQGLNTHRRHSHKGLPIEVLKKSKCNVCEKLFPGKAALNAHMRTHTGERPFACDQCDSNFSQKSALVKHVKLVHNRESDSIN